MRGIRKALNEQKERSRADRRTKKEGWSRERERPSGRAKNVFTGYETLQSEATILGTARTDSGRRDGGGDEGDLFFDITPFYGESGGQMCDDGVLRAAIPGLSCLPSTGSGTTFGHTVYR